MSSRTVERNKAVRLAWEREQELVREGKGTRDWTEEQQQDILDPDKGKAYDEEVRAFEGQHMKSVAEYPEYRSNPDNIQFLTKAEHLEAHKGNWKNPTNWYYDPVTKEFTDFGDGELIPCKIIELSEPIAIPTVIDADREKTEAEKAENVETQFEDINATLEERETPLRVKTRSCPVEKQTIPKASAIPRAAKHESGFVKFLKGAGRFVVEHPLESLEIAGVVIGGAAKMISSVAESRNSSSSTYKSKPSTSHSSSDTNIASKVADIVEKANRASPHENDVPGHKQRYHTREGVVWRDKAPYHRGGKDS